MILPAAEFAAEEMAGLAILYIVSDFAVPLPVDAVGTILKVYLVSLVLAFVSVYVTVFPFLIVAIFVLPR